MTPATFATRWNLDALEDAYQRWQRDPSSVDDRWRAFFEGFELGATRTGPPPAAGSEQDTSRQIGIVRLIQAYRDLGHYLAQLDPLSERKLSHPLLELSQFGLDDSDLPRTFDTSVFLGMPRGTLQQLRDALRETYCRTVGFEYMHIQDTNIRRWLQDRLEPQRSHPSLDRSEKLHILRELHAAETFERFLHTRFVGQKRFSLEGAETLIPLLEAIIGRTLDLGGREMIIGMAHRGRLNVLANILRKPYSEIFSEFEENYLPESRGGDGDVKYHLGFSSDRIDGQGRRIHLSLTPNPSHLEAVNPVVEGRARAKQFLFGDEERKLLVPLLIHGDAAFAGQGLVAETLNLSQLQGYSTGGTIHIIVNNQIGFTTAPRDARSTTYCTDVAKMIQVPIFHVNGEDPEATVFVAKLAVEFRQTFNRDVVIDMFCYRRHGHNEGDEPAFTQPIMTGKIRERPSLTEIYAERLIMEGSATADETEELVEKMKGRLEAADAELKAMPPQPLGMRGHTGIWKGLSPRYSHTPVNTGVPYETLKHISTAMTKVPAHFTPHPKVEQLLRNRHDNFVKQGNLDWAFAESLAFGSLLLEGTPIRLSGQDSRRGTFSQRHAVLFDARTGDPLFTLNQLGPNQAPFLCFDSMLSEAAVLGFEFGYSLDAPHMLVLWEAQFGDFANGAQVIIDQFICCSQSKWNRDSGLVMLLPHGYEGQGPEHSSARLERFLQLCAEDNMQVANLTTPAQYFHLLRRQMKRNFRKPLILMTPKSLLRHKQAVSPVSDLTTGSFQEVLDDPTADPSRIRRVLMCSGKVYYDLLDRLRDHEQGGVAIVRVEQLYPFPEEPLRRILSRYRGAKEWAWVQEESQNMGAWTYIEPRMRAMGLQVQYVGRDASSSPATGSRSVHLREQKELVGAAVAGPLPYVVGAVPGDVPRWEEQKRQADAKTQEAKAATKV